MKAWREQYPALVDKYRKRLFEPIDQQRDLTDAMMKVAERPLTTINTTNYQPQIGTQNVGMPSVGMQNKKLIGGKGR